jgi:hypothetical protein
MAEPQQNEMGERDERRTNAATEYRGKEERYMMIKLSDEKIRIPKMPDAAEPTTRRLHCDNQ